MARKILKMCIGEKEMEINLDGYDDESIRTITTFIDNISDSCFRTGIYFNATLYNIVQWNDIDAMFNVKDEVDEYLLGIPYKSVFTINTGENLPFGVAARLQTVAKIDEDAVLNMSYNGADANDIISNMYYDKVEGSQHICFNYGCESFIPGMIKEIMENYIMEDNK